MMLLNTIKFKEMSIFPELFLGIIIVYLTINGLFVFLNKRSYFLLAQNSNINLGILAVFFSCLLLINNSITCLNFTSFSLLTNYLSNSGKVITGILVLFYFLFIKDYLTSQKINRFEYVIIILCSVLGLFVQCSANDLITAYLGLELQGLSFYILAAFVKTSNYSVESGLKYFILSSFSSSLLLFGCSFIYGITGSIMFVDFKNLLFLNSLSNHYAYLIQFLLVFILVSLVIKLAAAPFHSWVPDVYENAPYSSAFFFTIIPKLGIFILTLRFCYFSFYNLIYFWKLFFLFIALSSVFIGSFVGLEQRKLKTLLAYSSISHIGYFLISFSTGNLLSIQFSLSYLIIYLVSGLIIWSIFGLLQLKKTYNKKRNKDLANYVLLNKSNHILALILATSLFSLAGIPPLVGFLAKISVFLAAIESSVYFLGLLTILFSVVSSFYYVRIIKLFYFEPGLTGQLYLPLNPAYCVLVGASFYLFLFIFINPAFFYLFCLKLSLSF